jgi:glutathione peroxidase
MMKRIAVVAAALGLAVSTMAAAPTAETVYQFNLKTIDGKPMPMTQFKGKVVMLVNTASMCGFTPQCEGVQKIYDAYKGKGFVVLGVPSGDFGDQEYGSNKEVQTFCESKFNIKFPLAEKAVVKGDKAIPLYKWAAARLGDANTPQWNFHKYLIGRDGRLITAFGTRTTPQAPEVADAVQKALAAKS